MKFNIIHQPRRSGKTLYILRTALDNLLNGKSTIIFNIYRNLEIDSMGTLINYMNKLGIEYTLFGKMIVLQKNLQYNMLNKDVPRIKFMMIKELKEKYKDKKKYYEKYKDKEITKEKYENIFFDEASKNSFKKINDIEIMLDYLYNVENPTEIRFTYLPSNGQKECDKYLKNLVLQENISYKELHRKDVEFKDALKAIYGNNDFYYETEVMGNLLNTLVKIIDLDKRKYLFRTIMLNGNCGIEQDDVLTIAEYDENCPMKDYCIHLHNNCEDEEVIKYNLVNRAMELLREEV